MYQMKPILTKQEIVLPSCMYQLKPVTATLHSDSPSSAGNSEKSDVELLEEKQNRILRKLDELRQTLLSMRTECEAKAAQSSKPQQSSQPTKTSAKSQNQHKPADFSQLRDVVVNAHPANIPYSILALKTLWKNLVNVEVAVFTHSSVKDSDFSQATKEFVNKVTSSSSGSKNNSPTLKLTIIWKNVAVTEFLVASANFVPFQGEVNIIRFFNRVGPSDAAYENEIHFANETDSVLDICQLLSLKPSKGDRQAFVNTLSQKLGKSQYFLNSKDAAVADVAVFSTLKNVYGNNVKELPGNLSSWLQKLSKTFGC